MYRCGMSFRDKNIPKMRADIETETLALAQIMEWARTFASISSLWFFNSDGDKICFYPDGTYAFTMPASFFAEKE